MRTILSFFTLLFTILLIASCKKEVVEDPVVGNEPVFKASGSIGEEDFSVSAGVNSFYMHTTSSKINGVDYFSGSLSDGSFELEMGIFNGNIDLPAAQFVQNLPSDLSFAFNATMPLANFSKDLLPNSSLIQEIKWYIDGIFAGIDNVVIEAPGKYDVRADVTFTDGTEGTVSNEMILGYTKHATCQLRQFLTPNGSLQVWIDENDIPVSSVKWYINDVFQNSDIKLHSTIDQESYRVKAEITFQNGVVRTKSILVDGSLEGKFIDDFSVFENSSSTIHQDFNVVLALKKDGKEYQSITTNNQSATVNITNIEYFGTNNAGKAVVKITANINCMLKELTTSEVLPFNCQTVFGVEIE